MQKKTLYQKEKDAARDEAIEWQLDFDNHTYSYGELIWFEAYFEKKARRYGLVQEFKANGII